MFVSYGNAEKEIREATEKTFDIVASMIQFLVKSLRDLAVEPEWNHVNGALFPVLIAIPVGIECLIGLTY